MFEVRSTEAGPFVARADLPSCLRLPPFVTFTPHAFRNILHDSAEEIPRSVLKRAALKNANGAPRRMLRKDPESSRLEASNNTLLFTLYQSATWHRLRMYINC